MQRMQTAVDKVFHGNKRQMITAVAGCFIVYVLLLSGIFSYFHSEDVVTNRLDAKSGSVTIQEPAWDSKGQYKARASEPGMKIEKDPSGYNNGQVDLYIRLKMTIELSDLSNDELAKKTQTYKDNYYTDTNKRRRLKAIAEKLHLENDSQFLFLGNTEEDVSKWKIADCQNAYFQFEEANQSSEDDKLVFYFDYTKGDKKDGKDMMHIVKPKESTAELFNHTDIPIYKKDYLGVFDQPYDIILEAEGIPAANYPEGLTVEEAKGNASPFNK